jgi:hypothetical protein
MKIRSFEELAAFTIKCREGTPRTLPTTEEPYHLDPDYSYAEEIRQMAGQVKNLKRLVELLETTIPFEALAEVTKTRTPTDTGVALAMDVCDAASVAAASTLLLITLYGDLIEHVVNSPVKVAVQ